MRLWLTMYVAIAFALQWLLGSIDVRLFAFPVGIAVGGGVVAVLYVAEKEWGRSRWIRQMRSPEMARLLIGLTAAACIVGGCMPADASFQTSIPFVALLVALTVNLTLALVHRVLSPQARQHWIFITTHVGIWLLLFSGLAGAGDTKSLRSVVGPMQDTMEAVDANDRMVLLPYTLRLRDFHIETNTADGTPTQYTATILIDNQPVTVAVNSPHPISMTEDIYLMNFYQQQDATYCVLMVEHQPWKHAMLAGICLLLLGTVAGGLKRVKPHIAAQTNTTDNYPRMTRV